MTAKRPHIDLAAVRAEDERRAGGFQKIGAFIFGFSQLEFSIREVLSRMLKLRDEQFDVVTSPYDFAMLCRVTQIILTQKFPDKKGSIDDLFKACFALNDERAKVAHGLWTVNSEEFVARHVSRNSLKPIVLYKNPDDLPRLAKEAQRLMVALFRLFAQGDSTAKIVGIEHVRDKRPRKGRPNTK